MKRNDIPQFRIGVGLTLFVACTIVVDILFFLQNNTRDLTNIWDFVIFGLNVVSLITLVLLLFKEKKIIHDCKKEKESHKKK